MIKSISNFKKVFDSMNIITNSLPESPGHLIWPLEVFSYANACNCCNKPLEGTICEFHGYSIHIDCYNEMEVTKIEIL